MDSDPKHRRLTSKPRLLALLALVVFLMTTGVFSYLCFLPSHPRFGAIYETAAFDLNEARYNPVGVFLRNHLPWRVVQSPYFPSRYKDQPRYLNLKGTHLEWSIGGTNTGWLFFGMSMPGEGSHSGSLRPAQKQTC